MAVYPRTYNRDEFIEFLKKNNVSENIINKFNELPDKVLYNNNVYNLTINSTWYNIGNTYYSFELNYYCDELIEFLFSYKIFNNIEVSIDNLLCELMNAKYIPLKKYK